MRNIFGSKRFGVTEDGKRLHKEGLQGLYSSLNIIQVIKSRMG
jgi:hypothetical protein